MKNAVLLPWGGGHSTCESCIRTALVTAGQLFVCPLTGRQGVTPDELLPNPALRMAVSHFKATSSALSMMSFQRGISQTFCVVPE